MTRPGRYIVLPDGKVVPEPDLIKWAMWFELPENRCVKYEYVGDIRVSTIFMGLDHNWADGPPILWETMVFGGKLDREMDRCSGNREQAEAMHDAMVARVEAVEALGVIDE